MPNLDPALRAETLGLFLTALRGIFPGPVLEALIARQEAGQ